MNFMLARVFSNFFLFWYKDKYRPFPVLFATVLYDNRTQKSLKWKKISPGWRFLRDVFNLSSLVITGRMESTRVEFEANNGEDDNGEQDEETDLEQRGHGTQDRLQDDL